MCAGAQVGGLLNSVIDPKEKEPFAALGRVTIELIIIFAIGAVFSFGRGYLFNLAGEKVVARLRAALFCQILSLEIGFFDGEQTGELLNRLASDTTVLQNACTINISMGLRFAASVLISLVAVFWLSWSLTLVMLAVVPAIIIAAVIYGRFVKKIGKAYQARLADAAQIAQEKFAAVRTVRSFAMEDRELRQYADSVNKAYDKGAQRALGYGFFVGAIGLVGQSAIILVLWYACTLGRRNLPHVFPVISPACMHMRMHVAPDPSRMHAHAQVRRHAGPARPTRSKRLQRGQAHVLPAVHGHDRRGAWRALRSLLGAHERRRLLRAHL